jgi:hypothetical protein
MSNKSTVVCTMYHHVGCRGIGGAACLVHTTVDSTVVYCTTKPPHDSLFSCLRVRITYNSVVVYESCALMTHRSQIQNSQATARRFAVRLTQGMAIRVCTSSAQ